MKITSILGNSQRLDGGAMFGNAPRALWERWIQPDDQNRIPLNCRCFVVETPQGIALLETGIGVFFDPKYKERFGVVEDRHMLLENLSAAGFDPKDIDFVILSHLHFDHAGGLLPDFADIQANGMRLLFPNATYVVGKEAFERAKHPHPRDRASFIAEMPELLEASERLVLVDAPTNEKLPKGFSFRFSHGHTPGQMHTVLQGASHSALFAGDLIPGSAWVHLPITMGYDRYAEQVIDEKRSLYEDYNDSGLYLLFTHDHAFAAAKFQKDEKGKFVAVDPMETLVKFSI